MTVEIAAKKLGMSPQLLRLALQQRLLPFGVAIKTSEKRYTYYINSAQLESYLKGGSYHVERSPGSGEYGADWLPKLDAERG